MCAHKFKKIPSFFNGSACRLSARADSLRMWATSAYAMGMRTIVGVQLRTTVTKRNSNTNTSPNPTPNNPTYPTDPVTLLNPTISRFTSVHQQARIPAGPHVTIYYRHIGLTLTLMVTLMVKECRLSAGWLPTLKPSQLTESASIVC